MQDDSESYERILMKSFEGLGMAQERNDEILVATWILFCGFWIILHHQEMA